MQFSIHSSFPPSLFYLLRIGSFNVSGAFFACRCNLISRRGVTPISHVSDFQLFHIGLYILGDCFHHALKYLPFWSPFLCNFKHSFLRISINLKSQSVKLLKYEQILINLTGLRLDRKNSLTFQKPELFFR